MPYLAKSNGTLLNVHSNDVRDMCKKLANNLHLPQDIVNLCTIAGYLHDIGKACPYFQKLYNNISEVSDTIRYHNEIGCIFLLQHRETIKSLYNISNSDFDIISNVLYWHHAQAPDINDSNSLNSISIDSVYDRDSIKDYLSECGICSYVDLRTEETDLHVPNFFVGNVDSKANSKILIVRAIVIKSDWIVSSGKSYDISINTFTPIKLESYKCPIEFNVDRFSEQMLNIKKSLNHHTIICNAPAGYGKTYMGLVWALTTNKHILWVCPRNAIIISVYKSILFLLKLLQLDTGVEMIYGGERQDSNKNDDDICQITITNIDAVVQPMASSSKSGLQYHMLESTIVFDEYHEFVSDSPIYAAFCILLQARHNNLHAQQILLSATPIELPLDYTETNKVLVLPERNKHFSSQHNNEYTCNVVKAVPDHIDDDTFVIYNAIKNAQQHDNTLCLHSKYTIEDRNNKFKLLYDAYGKGGSGSKIPVASAPIMQASLDVSASHLYDSVSSPNNTMQRIGRCDRFGTCNERTISFLITENKSEQKYIDMNCSQILYTLWINYIKENMCGTFTLDELYEKYNAFNLQNKKQIINYLNVKKKESLKTLLNDCLPKRPFKEVDKHKQSRVSGGNIRNPEISIQYIVWDVENNKYVGPFSIAVSEFKKEYNNFGTHTESTLNKISREVKDTFPELYKKIGDDGKKGKNKRNNFINHKCDICKFNDTPYPVMKEYKQYTSEKGIVDIKD